MLVSCNTKMKKIMHIIPGLAMGGAESLVRDYVLHLDKSKFTPVVVVSGYKMNTPNEEMIENSGVKIVYAGELLERGDISLIKKVLRKIRLQINLIKIIEYEKPDVIHIHLNLLKYLLIVPPKIKDIPVFYTCHNPPETLFWEKSEEYAAFSMLKNKRLRIISLQKELTNDINKFFGIEDTITLENCIDLSKYRYSLDRLEQKREELGFNEDDFIIGHTGRFVKQKNHAFLINVFNEILALNSKAKLLLIGDGVLKNHIVQQIKQLGIEKKVTILSNRSDVNELLQIMDRFVFPSIFEGFGIAVLEAQAAEIPCIVSEAISDEVCVSEQFYKLSLEQSASDWAKTVLYLDKKDNETEVKDINIYSLANVIKKLEELYLENWE